MHNRIVSIEEIKKYDKIIDDDPLIPTAMKTIQVIREVCRAGLWLSEQLVKSGCPDILIPRISWTAGKLSFGRDVWDVHQEILQKYQDNELLFEEDPDEIKN
jgi:hypothetical protein